MKVKMYRCLFLCVGVFAFSVPSLRAQGTAFTYQGRLSDGTNPATGSYDLRFGLYDAESAGTQQGNLLTNSATAVTNGLFTVTLDFGDQFPGPTRWMEIGVRTNGASSFTTLSPRQQLTPTPYAIVAESLVAGGIAPGTYGNLVNFSNANNSFSGAFSGNGANMANVNAATLGGVASSGFWKTTGDSGTKPGVNFLGTMDDQPLELWVNGGRAFRLQPGALGVSLIGGTTRNTIDTNADFSSIAGGDANAIQTTSDYSAIGGGFGNRIQDGTSCTIGGGEVNQIQGDASLATMGGGYGNVVQSNGDYATIGGGYGNTVLDAFGCVPGGYGNVAGYHAFAAGTKAQANHSGSFVWADSTFANFADTAPNQFLIRAAGGVGIGTTAPAYPLDVNGTINSTFVQVTAGSPTVQFFSPGNETFQLKQEGTAVGGASKFSIIESANGPRYLVSVLGNGNVGIGTNAPNYKLEVNGDINAIGSVRAMGIALTSDRNAKENFAAISPLEILDKVVSLPLTKWNFKTESQNVQHLGPMAQDFKATFGLAGPDDRHISVGDEGGVALAAIQGLNQKLEEKEAAIKEQAGEIAELKARLEKLEQLLNAKNRGPQ
jgi:hypothetical protein